MASIQYVTSTNVMWRFAEGAVHMQLVNEKTGISIGGSGVYLWQLLSEPRTLEELAAKVADRYLVSPETARKDAEEFVHELYEKKYIEQYSAAKQQAP